MQFLDKDIYKAVQNYLPKDGMTYNIKHAVEL